MIKLVLTDLDDTLVTRKNDGNVTSRMLAAILVALDAGVAFGPVSGRTPSSMAKTFLGEARAYATGAFGNGQIVLLEGEVVHREWCAQEPLQRVADILDESGEGWLALYEMDGGTDAWLVSKDPEALARAKESKAFFPVGTDPRIVNSAKPGAGFDPRFSRVEPEVRAPSLKANIHVCVDRQQMTALRDRLRAEVPELDFVFPSPTAPLIDITPAGYGKGSAVRILADALGVGLDEVAVFGDSENDLSMLGAVENSVAVANAVPEVREAARWHIGACKDEAMADALLDIAQAARAGEMPAFMRA